MNISELYNGFEEDLACVEQQLHDQLQVTHPALREASTHLLAAGGKRLRPVFVLLSGSFGDYNKDRLTKVAVALELIHMATLVHDDVVDHAETRRGNPTVKAVFGNRIAMYTGDFMFAKALVALSDIPDANLHKALAEAIERMSVGEIEQIRDLFSPNLTMRTYLRRIRRKTAFLIEMSCALGAFAANCTANNMAGLRRYGYYTGMAFQITDDILDFTSTPERLGKPVGSDLRQGNITLPALYALSSLEYGFRLRQLIKPDCHEEEVAEMVELVKQSGGIEFAQSLADRYLVKANEGLAALPRGQSRISLAALATFVGKRDH